MKIIKDFDALVKRLEKFCIKNVWVSAAVRNPKKHIRYEITNNETATFTIGVTGKSFLLISKNGEDTSFSYDDKQNLVYIDRDGKYRTILKKPTYDQVYEFLYYQYMNPLGLINAKPKYYDRLNNIFKGEKDVQ